VEAVEATDALAAVVGVAGLAGTLAAIRKGMRVSLANKETLVAAGALVGPLVRHHGAELIPVDSEHSAVFQCLAGEPDKTVKRIVLTASGGPFRTVEADVMAQASIEQALKHPTWKMGQKITIDSATMMNKALEVIEAHWLFGLPAERINVIVHPQSVVHSFVEFEDHSVLAQLGSPDMRMPIQYALSYPHRRPGCGQAMDWTQLSRLDFEPPDPKKFPSLSMAYEVIDAGGTAGAVFNAANEAAVEAFLARRIAFGRIFELVAEALAAADGGPAERLEDVLEADRRAREFVDQRLKSRPG
jgi:1-deoxy-D-xylulose-5-phosphate reductoisomerase